MRGKGKADRSEGDARPQHQLEEWPAAATAATSSGTRRVRLCSIGCCATRPERRKLQPAIAEQRDQDRRREHFDRLARHSEQDDQRDRGQRRQGRRCAADSRIGRVAVDLPLAPKRSPGTCCPSHMPATGIAASASQAPAPLRPPARAADNHRPGRRHWPPVIAPTTNCGSDWNRPWNAIHRMKKDGLDRRDAMTANISPLSRIASAPVPWNRSAIAASPSQS